MSVGQTLRQQRLRLGIDLRSLSQNTCIRPQYLEAIEADEPDKCPGRFFYRSFVRQYAEAVGLNADEIEAGIRESSAASEAQTKPTAPERFPLRLPDGILTEANRVQASRSGKVWGSVAALVIVIVVCAVLYSRLPGRRTDHLQSALKRAAVSAAPPPVPAPGPSSEPVSAAPAPAADAVTVTVKATQEAWISLVTEGEPGIKTTLEPGDEKSITGKAAVRLWTGNAGGLEVTLNGKAIGSIGRSGQTRTIVFTPQGFRIVEPSDEGGQPEHPVDTAARLSRR